MDPLWAAFLPKEGTVYVQQPLSGSQLPAVQAQPTPPQIYQQPPYNAPPQPPVAAVQPGGQTVQNQAPSILAPGALHYLALGTLPAAVQQSAVARGTVAVAAQKTETVAEQLPDPDTIQFYPVYATERGLTLYAVLMTRHPPTWSRFFQSAEPEIRHACTRIEQDTNRTGKAIYPHVSRVLTAFWLTPVHLLRCVIIGQDPYPGHTKTGMPKAIGACFASDRDGDEIPDSLITVYKELEKTVEDWKHPGHPDIRCWGRQGVLLLNAALTVEAGNAKSHFGYWKPFTEKLMSYFNEHCENLVFLLWGKVAQKAADTIYASKHQKLTAYHPSSMNAGKEEYQFGGCNHFNLANEFLVSKGIHPIDWRIPP